MINAQLYDSITHVFRPFYELFIMKSYQNGVKNVFRPLYELFMMKSYQNGVKNVFNKRIEENC